MMFIINNLEHFQTQLYTVLTQAIIIIFTNQFQIFHVFRKSADVILFNSLPPSLKIILD
jgi:hypothetical protein